MTLKVGDPVVVVEHDEATRTPREGGRRYPARVVGTEQRMVDLIGLFELAASTGDELTEDQARLLMDAERAAHGRAEEQP